MPPPPPNETFYCAGMESGAYKFTLAGHTRAIALLVGRMLCAIIFGHFGALLLHSLPLQLLLLLPVHLLEALSDPRRERAPLYSI